MIEYLLKLLNKPLIIATGQSTTSGVLLCHFTEGIAIKMAKFFHVENTFGEFCECWIPLFAVFLILFLFPIYLKKAKNTQNRENPTDGNDNKTDSTQRTTIIPKSVQSRSWIRRAFYNKWFIILCFLYVGIFAKSQLVTPLLNFNYTSTTVTKNSNNTINSMNSNNQSTTNYIINNYNSARDSFVSGKSNRASAPGSKDKTNPSVMKENTPVKNNNLNNILNMGIPFVDSKTGASVVLISVNTFGKAKGTVNLPGKTPLHDERISVGSRWDFKVGIKNYTLTILKINPEENTYQALVNEN